MDDLLFTIEELLLITNKVISKEEYLQTVSETTIIEQEYENYKNWKDTDENYYTKYENEITGKKYQTIFEQWKSNTVETTTKNKKIAAGVTAAVIIVAVGGGTYWALRDTAPELLLKNSKTVTVEYGEKYEPKFENLVKTNGLDKEDVHTLQHNTKITSDLKNEKVEIKDEAGNVTGVEEKEYLAVGKYTIELKYDGDTFKQKVEVKDTKAP